MAPSKAILAYRQRRLRRLRVSNTIAVDKTTFKLIDLQMAVVGISQSWMYNEIELVVVSEEFSPIPEHVIIPEITIKFNTVTKKHEVTDYAELIKSLEDNYIAAGAALAKTTFTIDECKTIIFDDFKATPNNGAGSS